VNKTPKEKTAKEPIHQASKLWRWFSFETAVSALNSLGTLWIIALMIIINLDVFGRTLFSAPLRGVPELVKLSIVGIIFLQLGHTLRAGRITRAENLILRIQRRWPKLGFGIQAFFNLSGAVLFVVLFHASRPFFLHSWKTGEYAGIEGYITYPVWPIRLIILIGSLCALVQYLLFAWHDVSIVLGRKTAKMNLS
jgi:TRAP-type mannitol/chloroaromatic compound transport system permease small subunit